MECTECGCIFDDSKSNICPQCENECFTIKTQTEITSAEIKKPFGFKISETYEGNTYNGNSKKPNRLLLTITNPTIRTFITQDDYLGIILFGLYFILSVFTFLNTDSLQMGYNPLYYVLCTCAVYFIISKIFGIFNKITLDITKDEIKIFSLLKKRTHSFQRHEIKQLFFVERETIEENRRIINKIYRYSLYLCDRENRPYELLSGLPSPSLARYIEQEAEKILNIQDIAVASEFDYQTYKKLMDIANLYKKKAAEKIAGKTAEIIDESLRYRLAEGQNIYRKCFEETCKSENITLPDYISFKRTDNELIFSKRSSLNTFIIVAFHCIYITLLASPLIINGNNPFDKSISKFIHLYILFAMGVIFYQMCITVHEIQEKGDTFTYIINHSEIIKYTYTYGDNKRVKESNRIAISDIASIESYKRILPIVEKKNNLPHYALKIRMKDGTEKEMSKLIGTSEQVEYLAYQLNDFITKAVSDEKANKANAATLLIKGESLI